MAMPMGPMMGEEPSEEAPEAMDDFTSAISEAFPDVAGDPTRVDALKTAIRICLEEDKAGGYGDDEPPSKKGGDTLALVFGADKPKKK